MGFLSHLSLLLLLSSLFTVYGDEISMSYYQAPHHSAPSYPPAVAPAPHHHKGGHHQHGGHHHGHQQHHSIPPVHAPTKAPVAPVHTPVAPVHTPVAHAPTSYTRKLVAVQGVVYCKSCKYPGINTLTGAYPLQGAVVKVVCHNTKYPTMFNGTTDKNGYFFIMAPKTITTFGVHKCLASLVSSPLPKCNQATAMHYGLKGAMLIPAKTAPAPSPSAAAAPVHAPLPFNVYTVGPFAFEPSSKLPCLH